eukprot:5655152-Amphidinium_carterae.1
MGLQQAYEGTMIKKGFRHILDWERKQVTDSTTSLFGCDVTRRAAPLATDYESMVINASPSFCGAQDGHDAVQLCNTREPDLPPVVIRCLF